MSATSATASPASYTTIPISGGAVVSRSTQNLSACLSRARPWPEFLATTAVIDLPPSFSAAIDRLRRNSSYFSINYAIIVTACAAASLIGAPIALIVIGFVFFLWLILHFFREDPLLIWGYHVNDLAVILGLVLVSIAALWITGPLNNLSIGIGVGLLIFVIHGVLRNPEGLFMDENDAVSDGLVSSQSTAFSPRNGGIQFNQHVRGLFNLPSLTPWPAKEIDFQASGRVSHSISVLDMLYAYSPAAKAMAISPA